MKCRSKMGMIMIICIYLHFPITCIWFIFISSNSSILIPFIKTLECKKHIYCDSLVIHLHVLIIVEPVSLIILKLWCSDVYMFPLWLSIYGNSVQFIWQRLTQYIIYQLYTRLLLHVHVHVHIYNTYIWRVLFKFRTLWISLS